MHRIHGAVLAVLLATEIVVAQVVAQEELLDAPRKVEQITFAPPASASIRLTSRIRRTGKVVSISREKMVVQVGRDNNEVDIPISEIQRVNTLDGEFTYVPANDSFERLKIKARRVNYIRVETVETYEPPPEGLPVEETGATNARPPAPNPAANPGTQPVSPAGGPGAGPPGSTGHPPVTDPSGVGDPSQPEPPQREPQPGETVYFCGKCQGLLPPTIHNGDKCPHCGTILTNAVPPAPMSSPTPNGGGGNPYAGGPAYPEVPAVQGVASAGPAAPAGQPGGGGSVVARGTGLADLPTWVKVGFFVGILAIAWLLMQRR